MESFKSIEIVRCRPLYEYTIPDGPSRLPLENRSLIWAQDLMRDVEELEFPRRYIVNTCGIWLDGENICINDTRQISLVTDYEL